jgi:hypothetical protein
MSAADGSYYPGDLFEYQANPRGGWMMADVAGRVI